MSLVFYVVPFSTANITSAVLDELEHALDKPLAERRKLSIEGGDTRTPLYLSTINPNGRVPAIVHDGVAIWESAAITMYLGETFGVDVPRGTSEKDDDKATSSSSLYPAPGPRRGEAMKWIVWGNTTLGAAGGRLADSLPAGTPGAAVVGSLDHIPESEQTEVGTQAQARRAKKDIATALRILDGALDGKEYLLGRAYCLADTHVWTFMSWLRVMGVDTESYANVKAWTARVGARPALKKA
ncbi:MAG: hypothetical protein M1838_000178 [Thelocarpon superellum]|nr:MAG: hypothetical protein M1838_000178 [Thelocarpon superellum]